MQFIQLLNREIRLSDDRAQRATVEFVVVRHYQLRERVVTPQDDMATMLAFPVEAGFFEGTNALATGDTWEFDHTATTSVSR